MSSIYEMFILPTGTVDGNDIIMYGDRSGDQGRVSRATVKDFIFGGGGAVRAASSAVIVNLTGTTSETVMATYTIPANTLGANGLIRVRTFWSGMTSSANSKTFRLRLGGLSGTSFSAAAMTTVTGAHAYWEIQNRNATNSQFGVSLASRGSDSLQTFNAGSTGSIDTTAAQDLVITAQLASGAEAVQLDKYTIEIVAG